MAAPVVSVLLTAYNREDYLAASIESVLGQTFGDFELIITDDCSSDRSLAIARDFEARDARIRVHANERNLGDYGNRNFAASLARGEFLKFHDSDDIMYPHCLEVMVRAMRSEPRAGFGLSIHRAWPGGPAPMFLTPRQSYQREFLGFGLFMGGPSAALFRTGVFRELDGFEDHGTPSDAIFWMRACARYPVLLLPTDLFYYREQAGQTFHEQGAARKYASVPAYAWRALSSVECPLSEAERMVARRNLAFSTAKSIWGAARSGNFGLAWIRTVKSGLSPVDWARYLRPPRRSASAGVETTEPTP